MKKLCTDYIVHGGTQPAVNAGSPPDARKVYIRPIRPLAGTHDEVRRHGERLRSSPTLAIRLIVAPDSVYLETGAFSPHDNTWRRISTLVANGAH